MATRKIVKIGDETLRKVCRPQEKFDLRLHVLLKDMADTMYKAEGVGLAAPQVGILRRIAVVDVTEDHSGLKELINPEILESSGTQTGREGCLSVPERQGVVTRPMKVKVRFQDRHGNWMRLETEGFEARAICHELDHLDGVLYVDKMDRELTEEEIEGEIPEDKQQN
ncbi:MAG: peptide deformylase [Clostridia bacterium]|nr:peptide deformylase [Clostridia bacterium]MBQ9251992.1 peptide deformylase [Clostridia bacterium]